MSSGKIIEVIDEYRKRVAPLALKWHEWKENQPEASEQPMVEEKAEKVDEQKREEKSEQEPEITDEDKPSDENLGD